MHESAEHPLIHLIIWVAVNTLSTSDMSKLVQECNAIRLVWENIWMKLTVDCFILLFFFSHSATRPAWENSYWLFHSPKFPFLRLLLTEEHLILSNNEIILHRLPLLFHMLAWNLLISLLALILQRATSGQVLSLSHILMLGFLVVSC